MIFALCIGLILGCLVLLSLTMPIYCVEVGDAKVYFFSKKKADRFYQINVELYENLAELNKELDDIQKLVEASTSSMN